MSNPTFQYDLFLSYRRKDGKIWANWIRRRLVNYRLPSTFGRRRKERLKVYQDIAYERVDSDYWTNSVLPALASSRYLGVVITPGVMESGPEAQANWVEREISAFTSLPQAANIFAMTAVGVNVLSLPVGLRQKFPQLEQIDIQDVRPIWKLLLRRGKLENAVATIAATLYDIAPEEMPLFRREEQIRKRRRLTIVSIAVIIMVGTLLFAGKRQLDIQHQAAVSEAVKIRTAAETNYRGKANLLETSVLLAIEAAKRQDSLQVDDPATYDALIKPLRLQPRDIRTLDASSSFQAAAFSPDGELLVTGEANGTLRLWRTSDGAVADIKILDKTIKTLAFSEDGHSLAVYGQTISNSAENKVEPLSVWKITSQHSLTFFQNRSIGGEIKYISQNGRVIVYADDSNVRGLRAWDSEHPTLTSSLPIKEVIAISTTGDGECLGVIREVHDVRSFELLSYPKYIVEVHDHWQKSDRRQVFTKVFRSSDYEPAGLRSKGDFTLTGLSFDPVDDLLVVTGGLQGKPIAELWQYRTNERRLLPGEDHSDEIFPATFSSDGKYLAVPGRDFLSIWALKDGKELRPRLEQGPVTAVTFNTRNPNQFASAASDGTARIWEIDEQESGAQVREISRMSHPYEVSSVIFSPGGADILSMDSQRGQLWHLALNQGEYYNIESPPTTLSLSSDGAYLIARTVDGRVVLFQNWNTSRPFPKYIEPESKESLYSDARISADGRRAVAVDETGGVWLWSMPGFELKDRREGSGKYAELRRSVPVENLRMNFSTNPSRVDINYDGSIVAVTIPTGFDDHFQKTSELRIYDTRKGELEIRKIFPLSCSQNPVAFSPDGRTLAVGEGCIDSLVRFIQTSRLLSEPLLAISTIPGITVRNHVFQIAFSPDGQLVGVAHGSTDIWKNWGDGQAKLQRFELKSELSHSIVLMSDGRSLATGGWGSGIQGWRLSNSGALPAAETMRLDASEASAPVTVSPDNQYLVVVVKNGIRLVRWRRSDQLVEACRHVSRNLTNDEWQNYVGDGECSRTCPSAPPCAPK